MYKAAVRWMIRHSIAKLNGGDYGPSLAMYADDGTLSFPGDNVWANQHRPTVKGREVWTTHRGRKEIEAFLAGYVATGMQMVVEDILVNGPPWNTRAAVRVHHWVPGEDGDRYNNRAVLFVNTSWGKIHRHEDYEDTERAAAAFDAIPT